MLQKFSTDLSTQEIYAQGSELATMMGKDRDEHGEKVYTYDDKQSLLVSTIPNPVLLSDSYKVQQISDYIARETTLALLNKPRKITSFDDFSLDFDQSKYPTLWGPNIDTLFFCRALQKEFDNPEDYTFKMYRTALEIGCGSGFIGHYIGHKINENRTDYKDWPSISFVDINPEAEKFYYDTREKYSNSMPYQSDIFIQDARELVQSHHTWDLMVCNPPYIPRPNSVENNAYEGLELLTFLIENFHNLVDRGGTFVTNISSLSKKIIDPVLANSGLKVEVIDRIQVPLKVFNVLNNPERLDHLKKEHGLIDNMHDGHQYWHELTALKITA